MIDNFGLIYISVETGYASFFNDTNRKPFVVILDHEKECIVLAVRGMYVLHLFVRSCCFRGVI